MPGGAHLRALAAAAVLAALLTGCGGPVDVGSGSATAAEGCGRLVAALPDHVADQPRRDVDPPDAPAAAWGDPPIVLRCGVPVPASYADARVCTTVNGIDWFIPPEQLDSAEPVDLTMTTVTREPVVEVRMPKEYAPQATTMVDLAETLSDHTRSTGPCT